MSTHTQRPANRLSEETSPYLRQHAHNPVDWFPWNEDALTKARTENRPIFLSVGYSSCHWCHVMERESFEDEEIAAFLNANFVCIKVDREERPDIDQIYMNIVQLMTGRGGWPMSVFLSPDQSPIFAGTYFPPHDAMGMPSFRRVIQEVARIHRENPPQLAEQRKHLLQALEQVSQIEAKPSAVQKESLESAAKTILQEFDSEYGGFGDAPKFPQTMALSFLLRRFYRTGRADYLQVVTHSLRRMAEGGIYDHLAGGFARYSVDHAWAVPHFEKMLYDNALLARLYFETFQVTEEEFFADVGRGILDFVASDMTSPEGLFYSAYDADSEGEEGKFYVWTPKEIAAVLENPADAQLFCRRFGVDAAGNFEHGSTVLAIHRSLSSLAAEEKQSENEVAQRLDLAREKLLSARAKRVAPGLDTKALTSWNALMIRAFVRGFEATGEARYQEIALRAGKALLERCYADEKLQAVFAGGKARFPAYLDDHAFLAAAMLDLFELSADAKWLSAALTLQQTIRSRFRDSDRADYFFTGTGHEKLIQRPKHLYDGSIPAGNSVVAENYLRLAALSDEEADMDAEAKAMLELLFERSTQRPMGFAYLLEVADRYLGPKREIVVAMGPRTPQNLALESAVRASYRPSDILLWQTGQGTYPRGVQDRFQGRAPKEGKTTLFACQGKTCSAPMTTLEEWNRWVSAKQ